MGSGRSDINRKKTAVCVPVSAQESKNPLTWVLSPFSDFLPKNFISSFHASSNYGQIATPHSCLRYVPDTYLMIIQHYTTLQMR